MWKIVLLLLAFGFAPKHEFHNSLAEVHYNPKTHSLEVALRVFADDFTLALNQESKKTWVENDLAKPENYKYIQIYLVKHFALLSKDNDVKVGELLGTELERDVLWVYFEFKECSNLNAYKLLNSVLVNQFTDQTNVVSILYPTWKESLLFTSSEKLKEFPKQP